MLAANLQTNGRAGGSDSWNTLSSLTAGSVVVHVCRSVIAAMPHPSHRAGLAGCPVYPQVIYIPNAI